MTNPLHLTRAELAALRNLKSGFYDPPTHDVLWGRLRELGLVVAKEPPKAPLVLTIAGERYSTRGAARVGESV